MSADDYARAVIAEGQRRGITPRGIQIALATVYVESNWLMYANAKVPASMALPHDAVGSDGLSVGLFQQQVRNDGNGWWWGDAAACMDQTRSAGLFYDRLARLNYNGPNSPGSYAQAVQQSAYPDRYDQRMGDATALYNRLATGAQPVTDPNRPSYNEFAVWTKNCKPRGGVKPSMFLIHTQQGGGGNSAAEDLANFCRSTEGTADPVSYHYYIDQASDGGVTLVDGVDTDLYSYSVGNANSRSINLCFAGSSVEWTRDQWLQQDKAIDVAAYIAVQDAKKYGFSTLVVPPPYSAGIPGISDHKWVTQVFGWGTHTDVGPNFPWDVFTAAVTKYATGAPAPTPGGTPVPAPNVPDYQKETWDQIRGRWAMLGGQTLVEALAQIRDKTCGTSDAGKPGVSFD